MKQLKSNTPATTAKRELSTTVKPCIVQIKIRTPSNDEDDGQSSVDDFGVPARLADLNSFQLNDVRNELIDAYPKKSLRELFQFDALITRIARAGVDCNSSGTTDADGDCINCEKKFEMRNSGNDIVRIQIPVGVTPNEAARVLLKTAGMIEAHPDLLTWPKRHKKLERNGN
jgi:hypothetical protein